jgi:hypothetical protein
VSGHHLFEGAAAVLTSNLVSEFLGLDDRDVINDSLVRVEVSSELAVVSLDDSLGRSLNSLRSDSSLKNDKEVSVIWRTHAPKKHRRPTVMKDLPFVIYIK